MSAKSSMILLIGIAVVFIIVGILVIFLDYGLQIKCTEQTTGTVVDIVCKEYYDSDTGFTYSYFPVIEYQVGERTITQMSNSGEYPSRYQVGDQVEICYNPNDVEQYIIKGDQSANFIGFACVGLGSIAVIAAIIYIIKSRGSTASTPSNETI